MIDTDQLTFGHFRINFRKGPAVENHLVNAADLCFRVEMIEFKVPAILASDSLGAIGAATALKFLGEDVVPPDLLFLTAELLFRRAVLAFLLLTRKEFLQAQDGKASAANFAVLHGPGPKVPRELVPGAAITVVGIL